MRAWEQEQHDALLDGPFVEVRGCRVCGGDEDIPPCSESCEQTEIAASRVRRIKGHYEAAWKALEFARVYLDEGDARSSRRVQGCVDAVAYHREEIRIARMLRVFESDDLELAAQ